MWTPVADGTGRGSTAGPLQAQAEGRHYSTFSPTPPEELWASIATFPARPPSPEVCWVDKHLLVVGGRSRRDQGKPSGPGSLVSRTITDRASQISAGRIGQAATRRPGSRAQITPLRAKSITGDDLRQSAHNGGYSRIGVDRHESLSVTQR
jgi:hypothetical protein